MSSAASQSPGQGTPARENVLVVEDEVPLLDVFVAALGNEFNVVTAKSAREADARLQQEDFKVILADHLMPGENGLSLLIRTREMRPHMQRILVTGFLKADILLRSVNEAGVFRCLLKPVSMAELVAVVRDAAKAHDSSVAAAR